MFYSRGGEKYFATKGGERIPSRDEKMGYTVYSYFPGAKGRGILVPAKGEKMGFRRTFPGTQRWGTLIPFTGAKRWGVFLLHFQGRKDGIDLHLSKGENMVNTCTFPGGEMAAF
jgi:hypothetical protein